MFKFEQGTETFYQHFPWIAFEGIVYAYTQKNLCPFSEQIINLESNRVIPISSSYDSDSNNGNPSSNCKWRFSLNSNQKLKIVFKTLIIVNDTALKLETDGYIVAIFDIIVYAVNPTVYYINDSGSGIFTLSYDINDAEIYTSFFALISAVDKNPNNQKQICASNSTGLLTDISNLDYTLGYSAFDVSLF
uniref:CUB domain-containing protein n=1 Tax=Panagrolaimus sp. ES5 TaxID=591445 RepID=A0AC34GVI5_9BILA